MVKKKSYKSWSEYDDMTLIELRNQKVSIRAIAGVMQRTESSINNRAAILKSKTFKDNKALSLKPEQKFMEIYNKWIDRVLFRS